MTPASAKTPRQAFRPPSRKLTYRGVALPRLTTPPSLPLGDIKRAVAEAFAERAAAVADD